MSFSCCLPSHLGPHKDVKLREPGGGAVWLAGDPATAATPSIRNRARPPAIHVRRRNTQTPDSQPSNEGLARYVRRSCLAGHHHVKALQPARSRPERTRRSRPRWPFNVSDWYTAIELGQEHQGLDGE